MNETPSKRDIARKQQKQSRQEEELTLIEEIRESFVSAFDGSASSANSSLVGPTARSDETT